MYINTRHMHQWLIPMYGIIATILAISITGARTWIIPYHAQHITSYLIAPFIIIHTINTGMRLLYTAQLYNKQLAIINSLWAGVELICIYIGLRTYHTHPIHTLFTAKIIAGLGVLLHTWAYAPVKHHDATSNVSANNITRHTSFVWVIAIARSLSERHIIMPLIAWMAPASIAATYKVLHDTVMFVYRMLIKAIDVNDITILYPKTTRKFAFFHISTTIVNWVSVSFLLLSVVPYVMSTAATYRGMFSLLSIATLLELPMIPWERICEIRHNYIIPLCTYTIACITPVCCLIFTTSKMTMYHHVIVLLCVIHGVRTSMLWMLGFAASYEKHIQYPWRYVTLLLCVTLTVSGVCLYYAPQ